MKRVFCFAVCCLLLFSSCGKVSQDETHNIVFTDSLGERIVLSSRSQKTAVLFSSFAELWQEAGGTVAVTVGETVERGIVSSEVPLVDTGAGKTVDTELLLSLQPDFVLCSADIPAQVATAAFLRRQGIPSACFRVECFEDYLKVLEILTGITGDAEAYIREGVEQKEKIDALLARTALYSGPAPEYLFLRAGTSAASTKVKTAEDNFVCAMLDQLGAVNIAGTQSLTGTLSTEQILLRDPDRIFLSLMGKEDAATAWTEEMLAQDGWKELSAVQNGRYTYLPKELFHFKPNHRWYEAYEILAELLYPQLWE